MKKIDVGGIQLNVAEAGSGPVLMLIHGFPLDHTMWRHQIAGLSDRYRVIAPDLRGFGQSDAASADVTTMEQLADDVAALLGALKIAEPVAVCGLSMGGYVAWQFWRRHAGRLGRLILCDTRAACDAPQAARDRLDLAQTVLAEGSALLAANMPDKLLSQATRKRRPDVAEQLRQMIRSAPPAGVAAALGGMAQRPDMTDALSEIDVPTLVLCGEHDPISEPEEMRGIAAAIPHAQYVEIPQASHLPPMEQPQAVNAAIGAFLCESD